MAGEAGVVAAVRVSWLTLSVGAPAGTLTLTDSVTCSPGSRVAGLTLPSRLRAAASLNAEAMEAKKVVPSKEYR